MSATKLMAKGSKLSGEDIVISVEKNRVKFVFDHQIRSGQGKLLGIKVISMDNTNADNNGEKKRLKLSSKCAHSVLGHPGDNFTGSTADKFNFKVLS